jgi:hypothetical protein
MTADYAGNDAPEPEIARRISRSVRHQDCTANALHPILYHSDVASTSIIGSIAMLEGVATPERFW